MGRLSPTVLPDSGRRGRPGLEIAEAFGLARKQKLAGEDRVIAGETRDRARAREDVSDAARQVEFEKFIQDELGGTPAQPVPEQGPGADVTGPAFDEARQQIGAGADLAGQGGQGPGSLTAPAEEGEIVALPGQFMGGQFVPETVRTPTQRTLAGQTFDIDPTQTAAARGGRQQQQQFDADLEALVAAGIPEATARAQLRSSPDAIKSFLEKQSASRTGNRDPLKNQFENDAAREAFLTFRRRLGEADRAPEGGRRPEDGPISVKDALAELDNIYGEFDRSGNFVGSQLSAQERFDLADRWAAGTLKSEDLPELEGDADADDASEDSGPGFLQKIFNRINPRVDALGNPTPAITPGPTSNGSLTSEAGAAPRAQVPVLQDSTQPGRVESASVDASQGDSITSIRAIIETRPDITPERIKEILVEQGFNPALIDAALGRR